MSDSRPGSAAQLPHDLARVVAAAEEIVRAGRRGLLVTVVGTRGSTYRRAGARAVIGDDGAACGAISGGCLERDIAERFRMLADDFAPRVMTYDSSRDDDVVFGLGLGCRGEMDVLIEPFDAAHPPRLPSAGLHTTVIASSNAAHAIGGPFTGTGLDAIGRARVQRVAVDGCVVLVEQIRPPHRVAVFGGGPDAAPVAALAQASGWSADLVAPRDLHPERVAATLDLNAYDAAVVMTHNYLYDLTLLRALFAADVPYVGLLGPKKRGDELLAELGDVTAAQRARLHNPIGLDLGGDTPEEIALSIVAEMQAVAHRRDAQPLRASSGPIHEQAPATVDATPSTCAP